MKNFIATSVAVVLFATILPVASAATNYSSSSYKDTKGHQYSESIEFLTEIGVVQGYGKGIFKPNAVMNRVEMLKVLTRGSYYKIGGNPFAQGELESYAGSYCFEDVKLDEWYTKYVCYAKKNKWVIGYKDGFRPADAVTFAEALKMMMEVYGYSEEDATPWYANYIDSAEWMGLLPPTLKNPNRVIKRGEMSYMLAKIIQYKAADVPEVVIADEPGSTYDPPSPYIP